MILAIIAWLGILLALYLVWLLIVLLIYAGFTETNAQGEVTESGAVGTVALVLSTIVWVLLITVASWLMLAGIIRATLQVVDGRKPRVTTTFTFTNLGAILLSVLLIWLMATVGTLLLIIPGLIVVLFTQFTLFFIVDRGLSALDGIKASTSLVRRNLGTLIGFYLASFAVNFVGAMLCGIGVLVTYPVVFIAQAYAYRVLQSEAVAP